MLYLIGIQSVRICKRTGRQLQRFLKPVSIPMRRFWYWCFTLPLLRVKQNVHKTRDGFRRGLRDWKKAAHSGFSGITAEFLLLIEGVFRVLGRVLFWMVNIVGPVAAIVFFVMTINHWNNITYGLAVEYNGETLGYVENENVVTEAVLMAENKLQTYAQETGESIEQYSFEQPTYALTAITADDYYLSAKSISMAIVSHEETDSVEAAGLYVDDELVGVVKSAIDLKFMLQQILNENLDPADSSMTAAFVQDVQIVPGNYSAALVESSQTVRDLLTSTQEVEQSYTVKEGDAPLSIAAKVGLTLTQLQSLNLDRDLQNDALHVGDKLTISAEKGYLTVRQVRQETYTQEVKYDTEIEKTNTLFVGKTQIATKGENGVTQYTDLVTYIDGLEVARENVSTVVISEPVTQVVKVGTKPRTTVSSSGSGNIVVTSGKYIHPVPATLFVSKSFGYYGGSFHKAVDFAANVGSAILSTASGTVVSAGWDAGYGYNMTIQHDDGTRAFYAHCNALYVSVGQRVSQGKTIGAVGKTGSWATGSHLHFSLIVNGTYVNPLSYIGR